MRLDKMTSQLQTALADAQSMAVGRNQTGIEPEHLILALIQQQGSSVKPMLAQAGFNIPALQQSLQEKIDGFATLNTPSGDVQLSSNLAKLLNLADKQRQDFGDAYLSGEVVMLAALKDKSGVGKLL
ncbi:MAG: Clp protease N-terminal domain-containing protein, partial [Pseudohongiellaceae bacterium]